MTSRAWNWVALSSLFFVLAEIATIPVIYLVEDGLRWPHAAGLAAWAGSRVVLSGVSTLLLGRVLLRARLRPSPTAWVVLVIGAAVSAVAQVALLSWSEARFGLFDPQALGMGGQLYAAVGAVAVAGFATLRAPRGAELPPSVALLFAAVLSGIVVAVSIPGASEGMEPGSVALGVALGLSAAYVLGTLALALTVLARLRPWATP